MSSNNEGFKNQSTKNLLTDEQRRRIEENKNKALAIRAAKLSQNDFKNNHFEINTCKKNEMSNQIKLSSTKPSTNIVNNKWSNLNMKTTKINNPVLKIQNEKQHFDLKGEFILKDKERFIVQVGFCKELISILKDFPTSQYNPDSKLWFISVKEHKHLYNKLKNSGFRNIKPLPYWIDNIFSTSLSSNINSEINLINENIWSKLMSFQKAGVEFAISKNGRCIIADEMGLGKTIQAIYVILCYKSEWPVLIVCPSSVRFTWKQQLLQWCTFLNDDDVNVVINGKDNATNGLINILSYDMMVKDSEALQRKQFRIIIMDESHFLKSYETKRTKVATPLLHEADRVLLLSGTPALSRPAELFTQIKAVKKFMFKSFKDYADRYCAPKQTPWGMDYKGATNLTELQILLENSIMIRRQKKDVLDELPDKFRELVVLDPTDIKIDSKMKSMYKVIKTSSKEEKKGAILGYYKSTGESKLKAITCHINDLMDSDKKFIIFAHHQIVIQGIEEAVIKKKKGYILIDGRTPPEQRAFFVSKFQSDDNVCVAILSIIAANKGITLTATSLVIFAELTWNPGDLIQAEDRAHRIGQKNNVHVQYLMARNTADDLIWPLIQKKLLVLKQIGLSKDNFSSANTRELNETNYDIIQFFETELNLTNVSETTKSDNSIIAAPICENQTNSNCEDNFVFSDYSDDEYFEPSCKKIKM